jgi:hypothetical protein
VYTLCVILLRYENHISILATSLEDQSFLSGQAISYVNISKASEVMHRDQPTKPNHVLACLLCRLSTLNTNSSFVQVKLPPGSASICCLLDYWTLRGKQLASSVLASSVFIHLLLRARLIEEPVVGYRALAMSLIVIIKPTHTIG